MDNIVSHILEIDRRAKEKLEAAQDKKAEILKEAQLEEDKIRGEVLNRADARLDEVEKFEKVSADEKIAQIEAETSSQKKRLDAIFEEKHSLWAEQIFSQILGKPKS
jgi:vacuolar-type H+-ATPase subunit H